MLMRTIVRSRRDSSDADAPRQVCERRLAAQFAPQRFARGFELATHAAHAARPRIAAQRVDHRAPNPTLRERLEFDPAFLVEAVRGVDEAEHAVLDEVPEINRVRHGRRHPAGERFDKRQTRGHPILLMFRQGPSLHLDPPQVPVVSGDHL